MDLLLWLQGLRDPILTGFFSAMTFLGSEDFLLVFVPLLYWCVNRTLGLRVASAFFAAEYSNEVLKGWVAEARPGPPIVPLDTDTAPGTAWPSGHSENIVAVWGTLAAFVRRGWLITLAVAIAFLVGVSRLYLGLHWPIDVLSGWVIGGLLVAALLGVVAALPRFTATTLSPPWLAGALAAVVVLVALYPTDITIRIGGAVIGMGLGWWLERRFVGFEAPAAWPAQFGKVIIGLVVAFGLRTVLKPVLAVLPGAILPDMVRYIIILLWVVWLAPALFVRLFGRAPAPTVADPQQSSAS